MGRVRPRARNDDGNVRTGQDHPEIQAETESDTAKQAAQFQQQMAMAQLSELLAKVAKTQAEVEKLKASAMNEKSRLGLFGDAGRRRSGSKRRRRPGSGRDFAQRRMAGRAAGESRSSSPAA